MLYINLSQNFLLSPYKQLMNFLEFHETHSNNVSREEIYLTLPCTKYFLLKCAAYKSEMIMFFNIYSSTRVKNCLELKILE